MGERERKKINRQHTVSIPWFDICIFRGLEEREEDLREKLEAKEGWGTCKLGGGSLEVSGKCEGKSL